MSDHADGNAVVFEQAGEFGAGELAALVGVEDFGPAALRQSLFHLSAGPHFWNHYATRGSISSKQYGWSKPRLKLKETVVDKIKLEVFLNHFHGEQKIDAHIRNAFFPDYSYHGVFVEVGAAGPEFLSMSMHFRENGWKVIGVEPNPEFCKLHREKGYEILQYACGDHDEDDVEFFVVNSHGAAYNGGKVTYESFSSLGLKSSYAKLKKDVNQQKIIVQLRRLDTILQTHAPDVREIDILSVDVEGWELEVIDGLNTAKYRPRLMIIENLFSSNKYLSYMKARGYLLWKRAYPNDVFIRKSMVASPLKRLWLAFYGTAVFLKNWTWQDVK